VSGNSEMALPLGPKTEGFCGDRWPFVYYFCINSGIGVTCGSQPDVGLPSLARRLAQNRL